MKIVCPKQENVEYKKRESAYAIIEVEDKIAIVSAGKNYYLYGGGIEEGEDTLKALEREVLEEAGYTIKNIRPFDKVKSYEYNETYGNLEIIASFYIAELDEKIGEKTEEDHEMIVVDPKVYVPKMYHKCQTYVLQAYIEKKNEKKE